LCGRLDMAVRKYSSNDKDGYNGIRKQATVLRTQVPMQVVIRILKLYLVTKML